MRYFSAQHKDWELAGSKMGNALGIKAPEEPEEDDGDENYDAKAGSQFKVSQFVPKDSFFRKFRH